VHCLWDLSLRLNYRFGGYMCFLPIHFEASGRTLFAEASAIF
jgi:hypothetical protein